MSSAQPLEASSQQIEASLQYQTRRANLLTDMVCLLAEKSPLPKILEKVAEKSTAVLGDATFIVLSSGGKLRLEALFCADGERLVKLLIAAWNAKSSGLACQMFHDVWAKGEPILIENLQRHRLAEEMRSVIDQARLSSLIAIPIRKGAEATGVFISVSSALRVLSAEDMAVGVVLSGFLSVAMEQARLTAELSRSATKDPATGVYNVRFLHDTLARETARAQRRGAGLSFLMVDIGDFGGGASALAGKDKVRAHVAGVIKRTVRITDVVCRCGGDEFGVILPDTPLEGAQRVAEKIVEKIRSNATPQTLGVSRPITVKVRAAEYQKGSHFETLIADADQAPGQSKS